MVNSLSIKKATWPEQSELIRTLREIVFVLEQGVSRKIEWDGRDHLCQHAIALTDANEIVGTGRLLPSGHIGRIAVMASCRHLGVGTALLNLLIDLAREANHSLVYLNSQTHAIDFYQDFGFISEGPVFMEAGIPHQRMVLPLGLYK
ncbi:MAG: GNAT family N-acetyltransferase [Gammaproteobacteria bacterium]|nr:MAG: GNAT family N-acetyltransferase [Gammaproteobacteria bacterium]